jgi:pantoate kinase
MNYMSWTAMGAASSAYAEASRARSEVAALLEDHQRFRNELEFQKWTEELIYQFNKTVTAVSDFPANPVADCIDLVSFLKLIEEYQLDTSQIAGFEHKEKFEKTLFRAQQLLDQLEKTPDVQEYLRKQEEQQEKARIAEANLLVIKKAQANKQKRKKYIVFALLASFIVAIVAENFGIRSALILAACSIIYLVVAYTFD